MENIKDNKSYKRLKGIERALKLVLEMRSYSVALDQDQKAITKNYLINYITTYSDVQKTIEALVEDQTTGLLDWSNMDDIENIFDELNELLKSHPEAKDEIRELSLRIATLENSCPNLRAIPIEIMVLASKLNIGREEAGEFRNAILKLLNSLSYDKAKDIRDYLTTSCTISSFYLAFFKDNSTACGKDVQENFSNLLDSMIDYPYPSRIGLLDKAFREYYSTREISLNRGTVKAFLTMGSVSNSTREYHSNQIDVLRGHGLLSNEDFIDLLEEVLDELTEKDEFSRWYNLFYLFGDIVGSERTIEAFASYLAKTDNEKRLQDLSFALWRNGQETLKEALVAAYERHKKADKPSKTPKLNPKA